MFALEIVNMSGQALLMAGNVKETLEQERSIRGQARSA